nr:MAG TPA_asm: hypothetical protein [Caudoviricetes sp.]
MTYIPPHSFNIKYRASPKTSPFFILHMYFHYTLQQSIH